MTAPRVSIAIRAYRRRFLPDAIASVLAQTHRGLELVVYDDAGDLDDVAASFRDPRVRYHRAAERLDPAGRYRAAVALCRGEVVGLLDDDDRYEPGFVAALLAALDADPGAGVAFARTVWDDGGTLVAPPDPRPAGVQADAAVALADLRLGVSPSTALLRAEELREPIPDGVLPDLWVNVRAASAGRRFVLVDEPLVVQRRHPGQLSGDPRWMCERLVATFERLPAGDPRLEATRRRQLARARIGLAAHRLLAGESAELPARGEVEEWRWLARRDGLAAVARSPALARLAVRAWFARPSSRRRRELPPAPAAAR